MTGTGASRTVSVSASCTPSATPVVRLLQRSPSGGETELHDFAANAPYSWSTAGLTGTWRIVAEVRASTSPTQYVDHSTARVPLAGACTGVSVGTLPAWTDVGNPVPLGATPTGCTSPEVKFRVRPKFAEAEWRDATSWVTGTSTSWATTGYSAGEYEVSAITRMAGS